LRPFGNPDPAQVSPSVHFAMDLPLTRSAAQPVFPDETRVLLLRHAETAEPARFHGAESDVGLGAQGRVQAEEVARRLAEEHPAAVYSSAMRRARETAEAIAAACGREVRIVAALHERRMGPLSGTIRAETWPLYVRAKERWMAGDLDYTHEGGESYAQIRSRVVPALRALGRRHAGETIVIVAHGVVNRVLLTSVLEEIGPERFDWIAIGYTAVNDLRFARGRWRAVELCRQPEVL
jgi:broad specificity phosphatase PhoE